MNEIKTLNDLAKLVDYSYINTLTPDPEASKDGVDHNPREVFSGHYVLVNPTPISNPKYITHSTTFFQELGLSDTLAQSKDFMQMFSGDTSNLPKPLQKQGWATGYALSINGSEYYDQCPFRTGNGYGDGRAISIFEGVVKGKRWEMQLKGGGQTPYCRGADGRAVLRSSVREFLAQEHMHALGIPTSRSLTLYTSSSEKVRRPWFTEGSYSRDPEVMIEEDVAISTRVAPSFLRVGQIELFGRRARKNEHPKAMEELEQIVLHLIDREYNTCIDQTLPLPEKILLLATAFQSRLVALVANWIRVGYCQGNFNSDNTPAGGYTLDYGPFGFMDMFDPDYQPWTKGGIHFSFFHQPQAAAHNFTMFCTALLPLLTSHPKELAKLNEIKTIFPNAINVELEKMWCLKLGINTFNAELLKDLLSLMMQTKVDYTIFFRELSFLPDDITPLIKSFYNTIPLSKDLTLHWSRWLKQWKLLLCIENETSKKTLSQQMKQINPKYTLREWLLVPAYQQAETGDYTLLKELQEVISKPYDEQEKEIENKYYRKKPAELFNIAGISHVSCSS